MRFSWDLVKSSWDSHENRWLISFSHEILMSTRENFCKGTCTQKPKDYFLLIFVEFDGEGLGLKCFIESQTTWQKERNISCAVICDTRYSGGDSLSHQSMPFLSQHRWHSPVVSTLLEGFQPLLVLCLTIFLYKRLVRTQSRFDTLEKNWEIWDFNVECRCPFISRHKKKNGFLP